MIQLWHKFNGYFTHGYLAAVFGSGITRLAGMAAGFIFFALIAQYFGAEVVGRYAIASTIMAIIGTVCNIGFSSSLVRFVSADLEKKQTDRAKQRLLWVIKVVGMASVFCAVALALSSDFIAFYIFADPKLAPFLLIAALALFPYNLNFILTAYHQGCNRISLSSALRNMIVPLFSCFFFIALVYWTTAEYSTLLAQVCAILVSCGIGAAFYWRYRSSSRSEGSISHDEKKRMLAVSFPMLTGGISGMLLGWADTLMLGALVDAEAAGLYATAFRLSILISLPLHIVGWAIIPRIAAAYEVGNKEFQQKLLSDSVHLSLLGSFIPALLFVFLGHYILLFFGPEFVVAYWVLIVLGLSEFFVVYSGFAHSVMIMTNQQRQYQNIMIGCVVFNIILNFVLISYMGVMGAALATLFTQVLKQSLFAWYVYKEHGLASFGGFAWAYMKRLSH